MSNIKCANVRKRGASLNFITSRHNKSYTFFSGIFSSSNIHTVGFKIWGLMTLDFLDAL